MAIANSGAISLSTIQTEFGGSNPISINEYYAGGTYVPSGTSGVNGAVPTSGQISFSQFYGTSAVVFNGFDAKTIYAGESGTAAQAAYSVSSNGSAFSTVNYAIDTVYTPNWIIPSSAASNYEIMATMVSGTVSVPSAATGTWLTVNTELTWTRTRVTVGVVSCEIQFDIRLISTPGTILDTWNVSLTAERYV